MKRHHRLLAVLVVLAVVDTVVPLPVTTLLLFYVMGARPPWFLEAVDRVYRR